jgi:hypothetical protein
MTNLFSCRPVKKAGLLAALKSDNQYHGIIFRYLVYVCSVVLIQLLSLPAASAQKSIVKIIQDGGGRWSLSVDGQPFPIKGVVGNSFLEKAKGYGANSIRTGWQTEHLEKAYKLGLKVLVNLPARAERDGMNYDDTAAIRAQTERIISIVEKTKDHPAVLMWAIGNELDYIPPLQPFNPKVWDAVNQAARAIHAIDPDHPVMTVIGTSMMHKVADIVKRCPDIDLLGINSYGDIYTLPDTLQKYNWVKPYVFAEWGPDGYWEVRHTPWGAPFEQTGREKFICYKEKYLSATDQKNNRCLGSFVFYWSGVKQETTHTWFCMFDETGLESPLVGLMHYLWTGKQTANEAPVMDSVTIEGFTRYQPAALLPGSIHFARAAAQDQDGDRLEYRWEIRPEAVYAAYAGQGEKTPEPLDGLISGQGSETSFTAPSLPGPYRLFAYVYDNNGHFSTANIPFFVSPVLSDTVSLGRYTSRTMHLLQGSTLQDRETVKIAVYGQSISEQEWWLGVKQHVIQKFPDADIIMENMAIGGFAAQILYKTVEMDISSFYPDLVLLHIYGDPVYYDSVLYTIRSRTTAEVAIMTDHYTGENSWSDTMSYYLLPALAARYNCDIISIRDPWKKFLADSHLEPSALLSDDVHLNDYGNFIMAQLVNQFFVFRPQYQADPLGLCVTYRYGSDIGFSGDTLTLPFIGNKAEVIVESSNTSPGDPLKAKVDGKAPSVFPDCYYRTRPYNDTHMEWPWALPAMVRIQHTMPWTQEEWTCTFTEAEPPYTDFRFTVTGSVTGNDGEGVGTTDFISPSGRIIIHGGDVDEGGDWHLSRSFKVTKAKVNPGDQVRWKTYPICTDILSAEMRTGTAAGNSYTLFQGIPNAAHTLQLVKTGKDFPAIKEIKVYRPFIKDEI